MATSILLKCFSLWFYDIFPFVRFFSFKNIARQVVKQPVADENRVRDE